MPQPLQARLADSRGRPSALLLFDVELSSPQPAGMACVPVLQVFCTVGTHS